MHDLVVEDMVNYFPKLKVSPTFVCFGSSHVDITSCAPLKFTCCSGALNCTCKGRDGTRQVFSALPCMRFEPCMAALWSRLPGLHAEQMGGMTGVCGHQADRHARPHPERAGQSSFSICYPAVPALRHRARARLQGEHLLLLLLLMMPAIRPDPGPAYSTAEHLHGVHRVTQ